ncbi:hypothetical protein [uncultured Litoreibacter sp.]|uniref:hypothetical protein n=1 Tax=uncultured Litoreibacter sp. TaxID=1392394 RepID=UPI00261E292E|nr:hypothetical protein [uncultured Litoreibacter sp.]
MKQLVFSLFGMALVAGCASTDGAATATKTDPIPYTLDSRGIQLVASPLRIDFGRTDHSTVAAMDKLVGQGPVSRAVCPDGSPFVVWADGTRLNFRGGAFRGWSKTAADGIVQAAGQTCG